jgi:hypothetical protein
MRTWIAAAALFFSASALADKIEPGNWEFSVDVKAHGLGAFQPKPGPVVKQRCVSQEEAANPAKLLSDTAARGECQFSNQRDTGSEYSFDVQCTGRVPAHGAGKMRYSAETLEGNLDLDGEAQGLRFSTKSDIHGHRLGPCNS